jgi:hypothetical protein
MWSNGVLKGFMAITAHWMARSHTGDYRLETRLIAFRYVPSPHDGEHMANTFLCILDTYEIANRVCSFHFQLIS